MKHTTLLLLILICCSASNAFSQQWVQTNGVGGNGTKSIAVNSKGDIFIVSQALHRSTDGGVTWNRVFANAPGQINKVIVQPTGRVIAVISVTKIRSALFCSDDNGENWHDMSMNVSALFQSEMGALFRLSGDEVWQSLDDGATWDTMSTLGMIGPIVFATRDYDGHIFISADSLYRSIDNGKNWSTITSGITHNTTYISCAPNGTLYTLSSYRGYSSSDGGETWTKLPFTDRFVSAHYDKKGGVFLLKPNGNQNIIFSSDNGKTWNFTSVGKSISASPNSVCGAIEPSGAFLFTLNDHLSRFNRLDPENAELLSVPNGQVNTIISNATGLLTAFANCPPYPYGNSFVWNTIDDGEQWLLGNTENGLPGSTSDYGVTGLAMDSLLNLFAIDNNKIVNSTDDGFSWKPFNALTDYANSALGFNKQNIFFIANSKQGIFRSIDRGKKWI